MKLLVLVTLTLTALWLWHPPSPEPLRCGQALTIVETHRMNAAGWPDSTVHTHRTVTQVTPEC